MRGLPQKQNARRAYKIRLCGHLRRYKKIVKNTYIIYYKYMSMVGLDPDDTKKVKKYSMGMKQRLAIAQAIMESPQLLILDEPFNGLDKSGIEHIRKLLLELKKTTIVLLASHNKEDINLLCDETFELSEGLLRPVQKESNE